MPRWLDLVRAAHPAVPRTLRCTTLDWGRVSPLFGMGGLADREGGFSGARLSCHRGRSAVPSRPPLERLQSEIHSILRIGASDLPEPWARRSVTSDPDGCVWKPLCRDRHCRAREHRDPRCTIAALAGGGAAATDCAPHPGSSARPGRDLACMGDAAVTGQLGHGAVSSVLQTRIYLVRTTPSAASRIGLAAVARANATSWSKLRTRQIPAGWFVPHAALRVASSASISFSGKIK